MLDFFLGFVAGSVTCYMLCEPLKPLMIWIEMTHLGNFLVVTDKREDASPTNDRQATGSSEAQSEEGTCQMETDVSSSSEESNAGSSAPSEAMLSWTAELFEPVHAHD